MFMSIDYIREKLDNIDFDKWTESKKKRQLRGKEFEEIRNSFQEVMNVLWKVGHSFKDLLLSQR